jgi:PAS domain S-box-containing protein
MQRQVAQLAVVRYGVAVLCVTAAVILALSLRPVVLGGAQLLLVAILITGWVSGLRPALVAWVLATLAFRYYFSPPFDSLRLGVADVPRLMLFMLVAGFMATMSGARRRAENALKSAREELEVRVRERTGDLQRTNERLQVAVADAVAAQHRFRDLVNSVEGIVWEADATTFQFSFVSNQAERILGYPVKRWLSDPTFWKDHLHPEDREWVVPFCEKATGEKRFHDFEYRMIAADGSVVWLRDLMTVVLEGDRPARLRGVMVDITERRRAEYLTGHVFETSPDAIYIVGTDYRYQRVNAAFERRWRMPAERIVGMRVDQLSGMEPFEETYKPNLDRCFAGEEVSFVGWFPTPAGRQYLAATYSPLRPDSERVEAALAITRDLTDHARASEALQQAQAELAHVTRVTTLGELAASISHEVNQPLAAIVADANASLNWLATATPDLDSVREALDAIVKDTHRAAEVIQRIRQLVTKTDPQRARVDVNDVIRDVLPLVRSEVRSRDVSFRLDLAPALQPVLGDRVQLQQVLINLLMNGIEAMASVDDRPRELVIRSQPHEGDQVLVAVEDAGVGVDPDSVNQLFGAFFTTKPGGMGMGLSISRSIIEAHGGRLWATPNPTHGATFQFALPGTR